MANQIVPITPKANAVKRFTSGDDAPEERAAEGGDRHDHVADQVVQPEHRRLAVLGRQVHDQRLAGRLAELLQAAEDEREQPASRTCG